MLTKTKEDNYYRLLLLRASPWMEGQGAFEEERNRKINKVRCKRP